MNFHYKQFVEHGQRLATDRGLVWNIPVDSKGKVFKAFAWNLTKIVGDSPPPTHWASDFGIDAKVLAVRNEQRVRDGLKVLDSTPLSNAWQDLIKAAVLEQLLVRKNTTGHVLQNIARPLRVLASCAFDREPWEITSENVEYAYDMAMRSQNSGKLADLVLGIVKQLFDANHIADTCPLTPCLNKSRRFLRVKQAKYTKSIEELRDDIDSRKHAEKLPERRAFWEMVRIVFTEKPKTFLDQIRFAMTQVMVFTGFRVGEPALLPLDWKRTRDYYDQTGRPAGELGGYSQALMLRYFCEKRQVSGGNSIELFEDVQFIPSMFQEQLSRVLGEVTRLTLPLRETLRRQLETGRILPWFKNGDLIATTALYTHLTGNPILLDIPDSEQQRYVERYQNGFNFSFLDELHRNQIESAANNKLSMAFYMFFNRLKGKICFRTRDGSVCGDSRMKWNQVYLHIGELEDYLKKATPTKLSDTVGFGLTTGERLEPWELLFLIPKRALAEGRNEGICDVTRYCAVGRMDSSMLTHSLAGGSNSVATLFETYSHTDEERQLTIPPHSLRHLQNAELFRLEVADTIITKRFGRKSVSQSYEYDHRSLGEELSQITLPDDVEIRLGEKSATVAKLIKAGKSVGPIVQAFREIQRTQGDDAAFEFLRVEADGFHTTPYGSCVNSFTVDPCPKHLQCFSGCEHLLATNLPENARHIIKLEGQVSAALADIKARPASTVGRDNQIAHSERLLKGIAKLKETPDGQLVFPDGENLFPSDTNPSIFDE